MQNGALMQKSEIGEEEEDAGYAFLVFLIFPSQRFPDGLKRQKETSKTSHRPVLKQEKLKLIASYCVWSGLAKRNVKEIGKRHRFKNQEMAKTLV